MQRFLLAAALGAALTSACSTPFRDRRTPSGEFCSDMQVVPAGQMPDREFHRLQPIASDPEARTEAERLESLRKAACAVGGDAVIEAVNEEIRTEDGRYATVASGTAVMWVRRTDGEAKPLTIYSTTAKPAEPAPTAQPEAPPAEPEPAEPASDELYEDAEPASSAKPGQAGKPGATPSSPTSTKPSSPAPPASAKPSTPATLPKATPTK